MSLLWRDQLCISLKPDAVAVLRIGKGFHQRVTKKTIVECAAEGDAPWRGAATSLAELLAKPEWQRADVFVVLSNSFARFQILPANEQVTSEEERQAFGRHKLTSIYGDSSDWEVRISDGRAGKNGIVCGVDRALLEAIDRCCRQNRVRLRSVQPYLMAAYNRVRRDLALGSIWFAVAERERLCAMAIENGAWKSIHCRAIVADDHLASVVTAFEREQQLAGTGDQPEKMLLYTAGVSPAILPSAAKSNLGMIGLTARFGLDWQTDSGFAMAASV